jgi:hypothetical protein
MEALCKILFPGSYGSLIVVSGKLFCINVVDQPALDLTGERLWQR